MRMFYFAATAIESIEVSSTVELERKLAASSSISSIDEPPIIQNYATSHVQIIKWEHGDPENPYNWSLVCVPK